ncbi:MAG: hypothetical protein US89_C0009G0068 [Candidatus Peregrinibacteria bacterium GW2011_GWF2_38_29]|nr:MAG: hypothetical protein US89_C0009G0068 [Candidatus Peregrinibacteria bacterium GW2011_GWF2_38_29]HBB02750.1 hypothetical protein [Candidatus Peregrinibacteria bacterium]
MVENRQRQSGAFGIVTIIVITAIIAGGLSYSMKPSYAEEKQDLEKKVDDLKTQLNAAQNTLLAAGISQLDENKDPNATSVDPTAGVTPIPGQAQQQAEAQAKADAEKAKFQLTKTVTPMVPATDVKFASCGVLSSYSSKIWYPKLQAAAAELKIVLNPASESCFSENGGILTINAISPDKACTQTGAIYNFSISSNNFIRATVNNKNVKGCLVWPTTFGKRDGTIIKMEGSFGEGCRTTMYYDYDFIKNNLELKKSLTKCDGKPDQTINY